MFHIGTIEIETKRILLRQFKLYDSTNMFNNWSGSELLTHYLSWNHILMLPDRRLFKETISQYDEKSFY